MTVRAWFEGSGDELDALTERLRSALGGEGVVSIVGEGKPPLRTYALTIFGAPDEFAEMERLQDLIREADGRESLVGGDWLVTHYVPG